MHSLDGVLGVVVRLDELRAGRVDRLDPVPVGLHLRLEVLVLLQLGLQVGGVLWGRGRDGVSGSLSLACLCR